MEGSSKILILQKDSGFFYHREGFKSGFIFIKRPTHNIVNDLDDEIGVLIKINRAFNTDNDSQILFLTNSR